MSCHCNHTTPPHGETGCCQGGAPCRSAPLELTEREAEFLRGMAQIPFLPLARFLMLSSQEDDLSSVGLSPVYLADADESLDRIRDTGALLLSLEAKGLITLDYDYPLEGCDYEAYRASSAYQLFARTVREGGQQEGFLFDLPELELGSMALTALGRSAIEQLDHI